MIKFIIAGMLIVQHNSSTFLPHPTHYISSNQNTPLEEEIFSEAWIRTKIARFRAWSFTFKLPRIIYAESGTRTHKPRRAYGPEPYMFTNFITSAYFISLRARSTLSKLSSLPIAQSSSPGEGEASLPERATLTGQKISPLVNLLSFTA